MRFARPRAELVLASATAGVGAISIASALTPSLRDRLDLLDLLLPPWAPRIFTVAALAFGLTLVRLAPALARKRRSAWTLAVGITAGVAVAHLVKGLDVEEAAASLSLLVALVAYRKRFHVRGHAPARPLLETLAALGTVCAALALFALHAVPDPIEDAFAGVALALGARVLLVWLRPLGAVVRQTNDERARATKLVRDYGRDSLAFFALRRDKAWFFSDDDRAFLSYRVVGGVALVSGDPIGEPDAVPALLRTFTAHARANGWRVAVLAAAEELLPVYRSLGLRAFPLGREAVLRTDEFSLVGRPIRKVRQSVHRARRAGYSVRVLDAADADAHTRARVSELACAARGRWPERGFTMALDDLFAPGTVLALAEDRDRRPGAVLHLVPTMRGYSMSSMRRRAGTVNGLMEYLIAETLVWARKRGAEELSLNFCVFADVLSGDCAGTPLRFARWGLLKLDALFQLERLRSFSAKFGPSWRPRYVLYEHVSDAPLVGLAYLRVESLLTPPGPWVRAA
jgi:lysyl-tRNA synthetase class 2